MPLPEALQASTHETGMHVATVQLCLQLLQSQHDVDGIDGITALWVT
jgi:hypothetical protein